MSRLASFTALKFHFDCMHVETCQRMYLEDSARGPTGDFESSKGELPSCTSWSKFLDSFLSRPASLPARQTHLPIIGTKHYRIISIRAYCIRSKFIHTF